MFESLIDLRLHAGRLWTEARKRWRHVRGERIIDPAPSLVVRSEPQDALDARFFEQPDPGLPDLRRWLHAGALVLDLGCGSGRNLPALEHQGFRTVGIDCNAGRIAEARKKTARPVARASLFQLPFTDASFDAVVAWQVVCQFHARSAERALVEIRRVLVPDGVLVLAGCHDGTLRTWLPGFDWLHSERLAPQPGWPQLRSLSVAKKSSWRLEPRSASLEQES